MHIHRLCKGRPLNCRSIFLMCCLNKHMYGSFSFLNICLQSRFVGWDTSPYEWRSRSAHPCQGMGSGQHHSARLSGSVFAWIPQWHRWEFRLTTTGVPAPKATSIIVRCQCSADCLSQRYSCSSSDLACTYLSMCSTDCQKDDEFHSIPFTDGVERLTIMLWYSFKYTYDIILKIAKTYIGLLISHTDDHVYSEYD